MKNSIRMATLGCALWLAAMPAAGIAQDASGDPQVVFRFVSGKDMFYVPWKGNGARLDSLCRVLAPDGLGPGSVKVDGYGSDRKIVKTRSNRVKTELILRAGLKEEHFLTTNQTGTFRGMKNVVVITLPATVQEEPVVQPAAPKPEPEYKADAGQPVAESGRQVAEPVAAAEPRVQEQAAPAKQAGELSEGRWSVGLNVGVPFFWGDMLSMAADKTHVGFAVGVQGSYRISSLLSTTLSVDYARGKLGSRGYAQEYLLAPDGVTWYVPQTESMQRYGTLYDKVSVVNVGLGLDVNVNRLFGKEAARKRFTAWVTPTVYGQFFWADVYTKMNDRRYTDGTTKPDALSLGLGGSLTLRYRVCPNFSLQLKNSAIWVTDHHFDAICTPFDKTKDGAMWLIQAGAVWNFNKK